jgi:hypothetical protein
VVEGRGLYGTSEIGVDVVFRVILVLFWCAN